MGKQNKETECEFSPSLLEWYNVHKRDLPWRRADISPYEVLVSEIMLQQTQVSRVKIKLAEFIEKFPSIQELANANKADIIHAWQGMGYNRRALNLQKFAQEVVKKFQGEIPSNPETLRTLPGIGPYCAGSIASFAFNLPEPAIDVNVRRVFKRVFEGVDKALPGKAQEERALHMLVKEHIPQNKSADFHNALMDFASCTCTKKSPSCQSCPMQRICSFYPLFQEKGAAALHKPQKKQEQGRQEHGKHIPNRIYRGRIVEFIRSQTRTKHKFSDFAQRIKKDFGQQTLTNKRSDDNKESEETWLINLCTKLQAEGFISFEHNSQNNTITLSLSS